MWDCKREPASTAKIANSPSAAYVLSAGWESAGYITRSAKARARDGRLHKRASNAVIKIVSYQLALQKHHKFFSALAA